MLKVIGAGFGRTGTHSLAEALDILGYGPCYHMTEVAKHPTHTAVWNDAMDGKHVDWHALYAGYRSAVEWPTVSFLPQVLEQYPDARIILTLRDPQDWYDSAIATIFPGLEVSVHNPYPGRSALAAMGRRLILEREFAGAYRERRQAIHTYQRHINRVLAMTPSHRLLQYRVSDGWEPLCTFLGVAHAPTEQFPKRNEREGFLASAPHWARPHLDREN